jgi:hypothetical protein
MYRQLYEFLISIGQLYSPVALPPEKEPVVAIGKEAVDPRAGLDSVVV